MKLPKIPPEGANLSELKEFLQRTKWRIENARFTAASLVLIVNVGLGIGFLGGLADGYFVGVEKTRRAHEEFLKASRPNTTSLEFRPGKTKEQNPPVF